MHVSILELCCGKVPKFAAKRRDRSRKWGRDSNSKRATRGGQKVGQPATANISRLCQGQLYFYTPYALVPLSNEYIDLSVLMGKYHKCLPLPFSSRQIHGVVLQYVPFS